MCSASAAQPLSAAKAVGGPAFGRQQSRGRTGGHLHSRATRSGGTAESTARSGPGESGEMNGKHSFLSGYDDAWDSGSNGVGGHPPVAVITTLGCPHCKRVRTPVSCKRPDCSRPDGAAMSGFTIPAVAQRNANEPSYTQRREQDETLLAEAWGLNKGGFQAPEPHTLLQVKEALSGTGIEYEEIELSGQLKLLESIKKTTGRTTVPQVSIMPSE